MAIKHSGPLGFPWQTQDPFLFCVHHEDFYTKGNSDMGPVSSLEGRSLGNDFTIKDGFRMYHGTKVPGFPAHPHRGFETITIARQGWIDHSDSMGAAGRFGEGDVQWMTAGSGVQHSEMFPLVHEDKDNTLEIFQIWLNLPAKDKMVAPHFKMLWHDTIPTITHRDDNGLETAIRVMAGTLADETAPSPAPNSWAADPAHEVGVWTLRMAPGATYTLPPAAATTNRTLYLFKGVGLSVNTHQLPSNHYAELRADALVTLHNGGSMPAEILVLQGQPINEPVAQYGPFVMNTQQEIRQAINTFQVSQFGGWPWPAPDHVHPREKGRFAKYSDGTVEEKA